MKNLITIIIISLLFINCKAQTIVNINTHNQGDNTGKYFKDINNNFAKFTGTWENTTGNITFRVILWKITKEPMGSPTKYYMDNFGGSFLIIQDAGTPNEIILHNSIKYYSQSNYTSDRTIWGNTWDGIDLGGHLEDTCASSGNEILPGFFYLYITNPGITPAIAHWKIKPRALMGDYYSIPTDVMMTKVN